VDAAEFQQLKILVAKVQDSGTAAIALLAVFNDYVRYIEWLYLVLLHSCHGLEDFFLWLANPS
jgi:hypothetical protein